MGGAGTPADFAPFLANLPLGQLGFGGMAGLVAGYAAKKVARLAAIVLGLLFFALQILAHQGWITIHWQEVERAADELWRQAHQQGWGEWLWAVMIGNLPFGGAFTAGFLLGTRLG
ncbi:MAG: hypothetical protein KatS3mg077_1498 [Candidatus Binatia bacterium]|nr:MAG: hypothetical protein KatS3mg015_2575 [Fimbriimonadales bacterium]GIW44216.1 MAG: hypothetical protein KatS3mg077_1498 [Candidatus Binatia bacterium]